MTRKSKGKPGVFFAVSLSFARALLAARRLEGVKGKADRVRIMRVIIRLAEWSLRRFNFRHELIVSGGGSFVRADGICLSATGTNRYLKWQHAQTLEAAEMDNYLHEIGVGPIESFLDIGANFGENNLYFAKHYPGARNIAVEPSPRNLAILQLNLASQNFDTRNIEVIPKAVTDISGQLLDLWELNSESSLRSPGSGNSQISKVESISLSDLWADLALAKVDFVKIDIEGSEPLLAGDLLTLASHCKVWLIEFSQKASPAEYQLLLGAFLSQGFKTQEKGGTFSSSSLSEASAHFLNPSSGSKDIYFVREDLWQPENWIRA